MTGRGAPAIPGSSVDVLVTPVWRRALDDDERWNVGRTIQAMRATDHVLLAPRSLDAAWYRAAFPGSRVVRGPDAVFAGVWDYSRAMLDPRLYAAFRAYRFLVLAQTDAFLVRDLAPVLDAADWDWAGAPFSEPYRVSAATVYSRRLGELEERMRPRDVVRIGNGGLSVRRVSAFERVLRRRPLLHRFARMNEDLVLARLGERGVLRMPTAERADALFFDRSFRDPLTADVFGFHALQRWHPDAYARLRAERADGQPTVGE